MLIPFSFVYKYTRYLKISLFYQIDLYGMKSQIPDLNQLKEIWFQQASLGQSCSSALNLFIMSMQGATLKNYQQRNLSAHQTRNKNWHIPVLITIFQN